MSDRLTKREAETALAAGQGLSSREIADRLGVGVRTIDSHLASIYRKLGVRSRGQLVARLAGIDLKEIADLTRRLEAGSGEPRHFGLSTLVAPPTFVGRTKALARLETLVGTVRAQAASGVVLVDGESGIGKSSLVARWLASSQASAGALALGARCTQGLVSPFGPLVEVASLAIEHVTAPVAEIVGPVGGVLVTLLPRLVGQVEPLPDETSPEALPRLAVNTLRHLLGFTARTTLVIVVIEDLHWADEETVAFLRRLVLDPLEAPMLVIATLRGAETAGSELREQIGSLIVEVEARDDLSHIRLGGLTLADALELNASNGPSTLSPDSVVAVHDSTAGNAFLLTRLLDAGADLGAGDGSGASTVPVSVFHEIERRLDTLPAEVISALEVAAIAGERIDIDVVDAAMARLGDAIPDTSGLVRAAIQAEILTDSGDLDAPLRFVHDIVRRHLASRGDVRKRAAIGAAVGHAWLQQRGDDDLGALVVAAELLAASSQVKDRILAGELAGRVVANDLAALSNSELSRFARRILAAVPLNEAGDRVRLEVLREIAAAAHRRYDADDHYSAVHEAMDVAERLVDMPEALALAIEPFRIIPRMETTEVNMLDAVDEALARIPGDEHLALRARVRGFAAYQHATGGSGFAVAVHQADQAIRDAAESGDENTIAGVQYFVAGALLGTPNLARQREIGDGLTRWRPKVGRLYDPHEAERFRGCAALQGGDRIGFEAAHRRLVSEAERTKNRFESAIGVMWHAALALLDDRLDEASVLVDELLAMSYDDPNLLLGWLAQTVTVATAKGETTAARGLAESVLADNSDLNVLRALVAYARQCDGDHGAAWEVLGPLMRRDFESLVDDWLLTATLAWMTPVVIDHGPDGAVAAKVMLERFEPFAGQVVIAGSGTLAMGAVDGFRGLLFRSLGEREAAQRSLEAGLELVAAMPAPALEDPLRAALEEIDGAGPFR